MNLGERQREGEKKDRTYPERLRRPEVGTGKSNSRGSQKGGSKSEEFFTFNVGSINKVLRKKGG